MKTVRLLCLTMKMQALKCQTAKVISAAFSPEHDGCRHFAGVRPCGSPAGEQSESGNSEYADQDAAGDVVAEGAPDAQQLQARREANIAAMLTDR